MPENLMRVSLLSCIEQGQLCLHEQQCARSLNCSSCCSAEHHPGPSDKEGHWRHTEGLSEAQRCFRQEDSAVGVPAIHIYNQSTTFSRAARNLIRSAKHSDQFTLKVSRCRADQRSSYVHQLRVLLQLLLLFVACTL